MQVDEKLWKQTDIGNTLSIFPGILGELLHKTTPQEILRAEKFLPYIFWRWYMLENPAFHSSPYYFLNWRKEREHWPEGGQFFPKSTLSITKKNDPLKPSLNTPKIQINITVDYISFNEQPLIHDVIQVLDGKPQTYRYDEEYSNALTLLVQVCKKDSMRSETILATPFPLLEHYFLQSLSEWRMKDPFIKNSFSSIDWLQFLQGFIRRAGRKQGVSTDHLLDEFVDIVRRTYPEYGIKSAELEHISTKADIDDPNVHAQLYFWISCAKYLLIPFSLFTHLLAPIFTEEDMFRRDVMDLLGQDFSEPMPIYAPFTTLSLTPFGQTFFAFLK